METFKDDRGEINKLDIKGTRVNLLYTKKGALRSGDIHPNNQFNVILSGEIEITYRKGNKDVKEIKKPNELIMTPAGVPHLFKFTKDTVLLEWWDGPFKAEYYAPYRKFVDESLKKK